MSHVEHSSLAVKRCCHDSGAHASVAMRARTAVVDVLVRLYQGMAKDLRDRGVRLPQRSPAAKVVRDGSGGHSACDLAALVATHPVGHHEDTKLRQQDEPVLVVLALETHIGEPCCHRSHEYRGILPGLGLRHHRAVRQSSW